MLSGGGGRGGIGGWGGGGWDGRGDDIRYNVTHLIHAERGSISVHWLSFQTLGIENKGIFWWWQSGAQGNFWITSSI